LYERIFNVTAATVACGFGVACEDELDEGAGVVERGASFVGAGPGPSTGSPDDPAAPHPARSTTSEMKQGRLELRMPSTITTL
jgi:hypothetical protein